jgi:hypothetical protein
MLDIQTFFKKNKIGSNLMCYNFMISIILKNVTHQVIIKF